MVQLQPETGSPEEPSITRGDFDQGGLSELAITKSYRATLLLQQGGAFAFEVGAVTGLFGGPGLRVDIESGELIGDGREDIAAIRQRAPPSGWQPAKLILIPVAGGQYFPKTIQPLDVGERARLSLGDVDGDGDLDGICCGGGDGGSIGNTASSVFELCPNDGSGRFDQSMAYAGLGGHQVAGTIDIDGDGDQDVLGGRSVLINHLLSGDSQFNGP